MRARAEKVPVLLCPGDPGARGVAGDAVRGAGHGLVEVPAGPGLVVGQCCGERWRRAGIGHGISLTVADWPVNLRRGATAGVGARRLHTASRSTLITQCLNILAALRQMPQLLWHRDMWDRTVPSRSPWHTCRSVTWAAPVRLRPRGRLPLRWRGTGR